MGDTWGNRIKLSIFGESHGPAVGMVVGGLPAGLAVDETFIAAEMARRAPGQSAMTTARREADRVEIISGVYSGRTTGSAVCGVIRNADARSGDYGDFPRPGHADLTAMIRYGGHADPHGGGHFSGRLTAPLVFAGALAKLALRAHGAAVHARILAVGGVRDEEELPDRAVFEAIARLPFPVVSAAAGEAMRRRILQCKEVGDSVGGELQVVAFGVPAGWGNPFFSSIESAASSLFFAIPAVKGVEFGDGFALAAKQGSGANDALCVENGAVTTQTNRCGGVLGGITTGREVVARLAFKPTASISLPQKSVDPHTMKPVDLQIRGRHDPCIVLRAVPVAEAALALALLDCLPEGGVL